jgi:hypothetical protein
MSDTQQSSETLSKRPSLRGAIDAMCKACIYDPVAGKGTWRQQVESCTAPRCPLFAVRPVSTSESTSEAA